ncbi:MAG TPA: hypothetical protein VKE96_06465 [Vicinamibacterales bacterium]|nr:hypothetical protein [Vicinamibacterales bacterium]
MKHRWALVLVGAWIAGSICTSIVATENFYTIDRLLAAPAHPSFATAVQQLGQPQARDLLRYLSSELNRLYFRMWNIAQIGIAALTLWLISGSGPSDQGARRAFRTVAAMLAIVVVMLVYLTPQIVAVGRSLDFVPRDPAPPQMRAFWILHGAYTSLEMLKLGAGVLVAFWIAAEPRLSRGSVTAGV